jgi:transcriptional regulator with PAS, ATPase and Fis domain
MEVKEKMDKFENPFPEIIGNNEKMKAIYKIMQKIINTDSTILISGETGTGKELIAKALHYHGKRKNRPFVAVNCSALTETLLETELFGHVKGSFTGAIAEKIGLFEVANEGTFFMDEIGDVSPSLQAKLLRVLQEGIIKKVGGTQDIKIDVRIVAATNKELEKEVERGSFRRDLFYRLSIIEMKIPALRERKDDIPILAEFFLKKYAQKVGRENEIKGISPATMKLLLDYDWPGNVRELENEMERVVILSEEPTIMPQDLSERIRTGGMKLKLEEIKGKSLKGVVATYEKRIITDILFEMKWNKSRVAEILGISRQALNKKIDRYGIDRRKRRKV